MHEIKSGWREVNGEDIQTWTETIESCNILEVEVGTTGKRGGDSGHGGRTYFRLKNLASTDMEISVEEDKYDCLSVELKFGGDCELYTFIESLEFAIKVLKEQVSFSK